MLDAICTRWPGYTLSSALAEDGPLLLRTLAVVGIRAQAEKKSSKVTDG